MLGRCERERVCVGKVHIYVDEYRVYMRLSEIESEYVKTQMCVSER